MLPQTLYMFYTLVHPALFLPSCYRTLLAPLRVLFDAVNLALNPLPMTHPPSTHDTPTLYP